jgi:hypothetical protein
MGSFKWVTGSRVQKGTSRGRSSSLERFEGREHKQGETRGDVKVHHVVLTYRHGSTVYKHGVGSDMEESGRTAHGSTVYKHEIGSRANHTMHHWTEEDSS